MTTAETKKAALIRAIIIKVNASAALRKGKGADGDLFFKLAFMSTADLLKLNRATD